MSIFSKRILARKSTLLNGLTSYWRMDEIGTGTRFDSFGTNNLTAINAPSDTTGKIGRAVMFVAASSQGLSVASNAGLVMGNNDRTLSFWVKLTTKAATQSIITKTDGLTIAGSEFSYSYDFATDRFVLVPYVGVSAGTPAVANNFGSPPTGTYVQVIAWHDSVADVLGIAVNNGTPNTVALVGGVNSTANPFYIGIQGTAVPADAAVDAVGLWNRVLTARERQMLYGNGSGLAYPF